MSKIDLHIHSNKSDDGELSPKEIVELCKEQGIELAAITDHNSVRGIPEAMAAADGLKILSGVELDCTYGSKNFHLLGYNFDHSRSEFEEIEQDIISQEKAAAKEKIRLFTDATGILLSEEKILAASDNGVVAGELIAEYLLAQDYAADYPLLLPYLPGGAKSDMPNVNFYWDFFSKGKAAYVPIHYISLPDAVALIHSAGGIAVLAHPGQNLALNDQLIYGIIEAGIDGIEVFSSYHKESDTSYYLDIARQHRLIATCGSDFHGKHKPNIRLGGHHATIEDSEIIAGLEKKLRTSL